MKTKLYEWNKSTTIVSIRLKTNSGTTCSFCGLNGMRIKSEPKASRYFRVIHIIVRIKCVLWLSRWELLIGFILEWSGVDFDFDFHLHLRSYKLDFSDCVWDKRPSRLLYDRAIFHPTVYT